MWKKYYSKENKRSNEIEENKKITNVIEALTEEENVQNLCNLNMSSTFAILLQSQFKNWPKKPRCRRLSKPKKYGFGYL